MLQDLVIRGGHVLTMDPDRGDVPGGDVVVSAGRISAVGRDQAVPVGARVIDAAGRVVMPGLVDTHRHVWLGGLFGAVGGLTLLDYARTVNGELGGRFDPDDVYAGVLWGALQALNAGVTSVADWAHNLRTAEHADANVQALRDAGIRAVLYHGGPGPVPGGVGGLAAEAERLATELAGDERIVLGLGLRGPAFSSARETAAEVEVARSLGLPMSMHVGMAGFPDTVTRLDELGVLGPDLNHVHANELSAHEFDLIAASGGTISMSPGIEMSMVLGRYPALGAVRERGIAAGLATDTVAAGGTDLFSEMRLALAVERSRAHAPAVLGGEPVARLAPGHDDVLGLATVGGAAAIPLGDRVGVVVPGAVADLVLVDMRPPHLDGFGDPALAMVLGAGAADVETVLVGGEVVKEGGRLVGSPAERARELLDASRARLRSGGR